MKNILSPAEIIEYIKEITEEGMEPDYFFTLISQETENFEKHVMFVEDVIDGDADLEEYVNGTDRRYDDDSEDVTTPESLYLPIVILRGKVLDGWNRVAVHSDMCIPTIEAYCLK